MLRTITIGSCVSVQGLFVRTLPNGLMVVRVGDSEFSGRPVSPARALGKERADRESSFCRS